MPYTAEISRANPSCFLFLVDQSGSMEDPFGSSESNKRKADGVADVINRWLQNLTIKCAKGEGIRDYYHVGVIGYGSQVGPAFSGQIAGRDLVPISEIAASPVRIEERTRKIDDGAGGLVDQTVRFPVWFDPISSNGTPMCQALTQAHAVLTTWLAQHPDCFPPTVINLTDGESTDGDPTGAAENLKRLTSKDGNVLLFNIHLSSRRDMPIEFPDDEVPLPDQYAKLLFQISSALPEHIRGVAHGENYQITDRTRGFTFNADMVALIKFLDIGTRPSNLR